jgi:hypothetical protein
VKPAVASASESPRIVEVIFVMVLSGFLLLMRLVLRFHNHRRRRLLTRPEGVIKSP